MKPTDWKLAGDKLAAEYLKTLPADDARAVFDLVRAAVTRERKGDLAAIADRLHAELKQEFAATPGAMLPLLTEAVKAAKKERKKGSS